MITLLARIFIREDDKPEKVRLAYGILCGIVGILLNVLLFTGKFIAGTISKSIAITADAFNNPVSYTHLDVYKRQAMRRTAHRRQVTVSIRYSSYASEYY